MTEFTFLVRPGIRLGHASGETSTMTLPPDLSAQLLELELGEQVPGALGEMLEQLLVLAVEAVPSCVGVSLAMHRHGQPFCVTVATPGASTRPVLSSLALHLPDRSLPHRPSTAPVLTLYSSRGGELRRTATDLLALLDLDPRRKILDEDLALPPAARVTARLGLALHDGSAVDRALGVLLDREGLLPSQGRHELERLAVSTGVSVPDAARHVLHSLQGRPEEG